MPRSCNSARFELNKDMKDTVSTIVCAVVPFFRLRISVDLSVDILADISIYLPVDI